MWQITWEIYFLVYPGGFLEVVDSFCCLDDLINSRRGCSKSIIAKIGTAWRKFRELLVAKRLSVRARGKLGGACLQITMHHGHEMWAVTAEDMQRLERNG